mmetsp:Transcript_43469/g.94678  ORF Transcript_43469/g.94678 Transcript_43469/m.94678 type:complete len:147 (+) Transcript_43469:173-613(+)
MPVLKPLPSPFPLSPLSLPEPALACGITSNSSQTQTASPYIPDAVDWGQPGLAALPELDCCVLGGRHHCPLHQVWSCRVPEHGESTAPGPILLCCLAMRSSPKSTTGSAARLSEIVSDATSIASSLDSASEVELVALHESGYDDYP